MPRWMTGKAGNPDGLSLTCLVPSGIAKATRQDLIK